MTKREEVLTKLLRMTWECLPDVLVEDCATETDMDGLARLSDAVGIALSNKRVKWSSFDGHARSMSAQKGWETRRRNGPKLRVVK